MCLSFFYRFGPSVVLSDYRYSIILFTTIFLINLWSVLQLNLTHCYWKNVVEFELNSMDSWKFTRELMTFILCNYKNSSHTVYIVDSWSNTDWYVTKDLVHDFDPDSPKQLSLQRIIRLSCVTSLIASHSLYVSLFLIKTQNLNPIPTFLQQKEKLVGWLDSSLYTSIPRVITLISRIKIIGEVGR